MSLALKVENLSKLYRLGEIGTGTLSHDLNRWWAKKRGLEDPFLKVGETNDQHQKASSDVVWSLRNLNFEINEGDAVGIIGRNGAGKSTLLKILSRVTSPTTGTIEGQGRIASLLEVGTGFHPELSGRENIFLNGAILGMRNKEIKRRFDEIVDFAGVERYIDTPVKRYSSGMYVRLAFAVAAHLDSEILIVDEVLAVGDAEFQKKCLGKMGEVSKGEGRTVLFVSHNMASIKNLCSSVIILNNGELLYQGPVNLGIEKYIEQNSEKQTSVYQNTKANKSLSYVEEIQVQDESKLSRAEFSLNEEVTINSKLYIDPSHLSAKIGFRVADNHDRTVFTTEVNVKDYTAGSEMIELSATIPANLLAPNNYKIQFGIHIPNIEIIELLPEVVHFTILETGSEFVQYFNNDYGCVLVNCEWHREMELSK